MLGVKGEQPKPPLAELLEDRHQRQVGPQVLDEEPDPGLFPVKKDAVGARDDLSEAVEEPGPAPLIAGEVPGAGLTADQPGKGLLRTSGTPHKALALARHQPEEVPGPEFHHLAKRRAEGTVGKGAEKPLEELGAGLGVGL